MKHIRVTGRQRDWFVKFRIEQLSSAIVFSMLWALPLAAQALLSHPVAQSLPAAGQGVGGQAPPRPQEPWMNDPPTSTGLAVGAKIPPFRAPDQNGRMQDFGSIRGPKGAAIYFVRSADW